jgi:hypothetical protein
MSGAKINRNPRKFKHGANVDRPNGCSSLATADSKLELLAAILTGNRATRRQAIRKGFKMMRAEKATTKGKAR